MLRPAFISSIFLAAATFAAAAPKVLPVLNHPLPNRDFAAGYSQTLNLNSFFGTEAIDDQVVRFTSQFNIAGTPVVMDMALFSNRAPVTRANFLKYVSDGDYLYSFIHRSVPGFVIQGGGFKIDLSDNSIIPVPTDAPIVNEFGISNTLGTVSMAKLGGDPNSATSQWFVSNGENSDILDPQNGGFTVFGRITAATYDNAAAFNDPSLFPIYDESVRLGNGALTALPLFYTHNPVNYPQLNELILFTNVSLVPIPAGQAGESTTLTYSILSNTNPAVAAVSIQGPAGLQVVSPAGATGTTTVTIRATDSVGNIVDDSFVITAVKENFALWRERLFAETDRASDLVSGPYADPDGDGLTNLELFVHGLAPGFQQNPVKFEAQLNAGQGQPRFLLPIRNDIRGVGLLMEQSGDLGTSDPWKTIGTTEVSRISSGTIDQLTIQSAATVATTRNFFRLRFTLE